MSSLKACSACLASYPDAAYSGSQLKKKGKRVCRGCIQRQTAEAEQSAAAAAPASQPFSGTSLASILARGGRVSLNPVSKHAAAAAQRSAAFDAFCREQGQDGSAGSAAASGPMYSDETFFGQRDDDDKPHGQGLRMDASGAIIDNQCGVFQRGVLIKQSAVTRAMLPPNTPLRPHALKAQYIRPDGSCLVWSDDTHATLFDEHGREMRGGQWSREANAQEGQGFSITALSGDRYEGAFKANQRCGEGRLKYANGDVFRGVFEADKPNVGTMTLSNGAVIEGLFSQPGRTAVGTMTMPNGAILRGTFSHSWKLEGAGISVAPRVPTWSPVAPGASSSSVSASSSSSSSAASPSADRISAFFSHRCFPDAADKDDPDGSLHTSPGVVYSGCFSLGQRRGPGAEWNAQGAVTACGGWEYDAMTNAATIRIDALFPGAAALKKPFLAQLGTMYTAPGSKEAPIDLLSFLPASARSATVLFEDGSFYSGELDQSAPSLFLPHGAGATFNASGSLRERGVYERPGLLHCPSGVRVLRYNRGEYRGAFKKGQPHGQGEWRSVTWEQSEARERSALPALPCDRYEGEWVRGSKSGEGRRTYADGSTYKGHWRDDRDGLGVLTSADGLTVREGQWAAGRANGLGVEWRADGSRRVGMWNHDAFVAECPVPRALLPVDSKLSPAERDAALLFPDGSYFRGVLPSATSGTAGRGTRFDKDGRVQESGLFVSTIQHVAGAKSDADDDGAEASCNNKAKAQATAAGETAADATAASARATANGHKHSSRGGRK